MYKFNTVFYPRDYYNNINFEKVKESFKKTHANYNDYGSIFYFQDTKYLLSINSHGKLQLFYNNVDKTFINEIVKKVENLFKEQISDFKILYN